MLNLDQIIISTNCWESVVAGFAGDRLALFEVNYKYGFSEDSIYVGRISKTYNTPDGEKAYFVDLGCNNQGFWKNRRDMRVITSSGLTDKIFEGQKALFQVSSVPQDDKNVVLDSEVKLAGNFLIFIPWGSKLKISSLLSKDDADYLSNSMVNLLDDDCGWIVRSEAKKARLDEIVSEANKLKQIWKNIEDEFASLEKLGEIYKKPISIAEMSNKETSLKSIITDDSDIFVSLKKTYKGSAVIDKMETSKIWSEYEIDANIEDMLSDEISLVGGGRVSIEHTRAFTAIDVDSAGALDIKNINRNAAIEIARQIKLRNICGKIMVDFAGSGIVAASDELVKIMQNDLPKKQVLGFSKAGNLEIVIPRRGSEIKNLFRVNNFQFVVGNKIRKMLVEAKASKNPIQEIVLNKDEFEWLQNNKIDIKSDIMKKHGLNVELKIIEE